MVEARNLADEEALRMELHEAFQMDHALQKKYLEYLCRFHRKNSRKKSIANKKK